MAASTVILEAIDQIGTRSHCAVYRLMIAELGDEAVGLEDEERDEDSSDYDDEDGDDKYEDDEGDAEEDEEDAEDDEDAFG